MSALPVVAVGNLGLCLQLEPMQTDDLPRVLKIENEVYPHPWTHGNFIDALVSGYDGRVARAVATEAAREAVREATRDLQQALIGYFVVMRVVDEAHLLNISVHRDWQRQGVGRLLLEQVVALARQQAMASVLLEVRPSNQRAIALYQRNGFAPIGVRKNYYPAAGHGREDAIVMRFAL